MVFSELFCQVAWLWYQPLIWCCIIIKLLTLESQFLLVCQNCMIKLKLTLA